MAEMSSEYWRNLEFEHYIGMDIAIKALLAKHSKDPAQLAPTLMKMPRYFAMCIMLFPEDSRVKYWLSLSREVRKTLLCWLIDHSSLLTLRDLVPIAPECARSFVYCLLKECTYITDHIFLFEVVATINPLWLSDANCVNMIASFIRRIRGINKITAQRTFAIHFKLHWRKCAQTLACAQHPRLGDTSPASLLAGFPEVTRFILDAIADDDRALEGPP